MKLNKVVVAPDKFKGSITSKEFCKIANKEIKRIDKDINVESFCLADGGEGSLDLYAELTGANIKVNYVCDANFNKSKARFAIKDKVAFVELAETSGLYKTKLKNPRITTSFGFGEQILQAIKLGAKTIYLSIGGSSTNDAGCGMAAGIGYKFFDKDNNKFVPTGESLNKIVAIENPAIDLSKIKFVCLCDVKNTLCGVNGAACVYAKQKGATDEDIKLLDNNLKAFNNFAKQKGFDFNKIKGSGAAGGLGAGVIYFLNASIQSGLDFFVKISKLDTFIKDADLIITGEGKIDEQSLCGKVVFGLKKLCKSKKLVAFCGENLLVNSKYDFDIVEINPKGSSLKHALKHSKHNLKFAIRSYLRNFINSQN